ncbi:hypothetical protein ScPMuIL_016241 [Solemya velum]
MADEYSQNWRDGPFEVNLAPVKLRHAHDVPNHVSIIKSQADQPHVSADGRDEAEYILTHEQEELDSKMLSVLRTVVRACLQGNTKKRPDSKELLRMFEENF